MEKLMRYEMTYGDYGQDMDNNLYKKQDKKQQDNQFNKKQDSLLHPNGVVF